MGFVLTKEAVDRAKRTVRAADVLHDKARAIAQVCAKADPDEVVVAVVEQDGRFGGTWPIAAAQLSTRVEHLEAGGWVLLFSPSTPVGDIEARCRELARLASRRWDAMRRWSAVHPNGA